MTTDQTIPARSSGGHRRTHCKQGHLLDEANSVPDYRGWRTCRTCKYARERMYDAGRKERGHRRQHVGAWKSHCKRGHQLEGDNLYLYRDGARACRACRKAYMRAHKKREQQARPPKTPRTHCKLGHPLEGGNLLLTSGGERRSRACHYAWNRAYKARRREKARLPLPFNAPVPERGPERALDSVTPDNYS